MITIKVDDAIGLLNAVKKSVSAPELITWAQTKADPYMRDQFSQQFQTEGKRYGKGWLGIKESSLEARGQKKYGIRKRGGGRLGGAKISNYRVTGVNILRDTGELFNKVTKTKGQVRTTGDGVYVSWGGNLSSFNGADKYRIHQLGTLGTSKPNPPRPMISADNKDSKHLLLSLYGYMGSIIRWNRK